MQFLSYISFELTSSSDLRFFWGTSSAIQIPEHINKTKKESWIHDVYGTKGLLRFACIMLSTEFQKYFSDRCNFIYINIKYKVDAVAFSMKLIFL